MTPESMNGKVDHALGEHGFVIIGDPSADPLARIYLSLKGFGNDPPDGAWLDVGCAPGVNPGFPRGCKMGCPMEEEQLEKLASSCLEALALIRAGKAEIRLRDGVLRDMIQAADRRNLEYLMKGKP